MPTQAQDVLDFWFGPPTDPDHARQRVQWFRKDAAFDQQVVARFGALIEQALAGGTDGWIAPPLQPLPALARVIVLDQLTRNAFRGSARAFAGDAMALQTARALVASGLDRELTGVQRLFAYLPFEHAEDLAAQDEAVRLFTQLAQQAPGLDGMLDYAHRHRAVIARFGRFPHRNPWLGRASSEAELAFLQEPGSSF